MNRFHKTTLVLLTCGIFSFATFARRDPQATAGVVSPSDLVQRATVAGTVVPLRKSFILSPYNGCMKIYVRVGDRVKAGAPLLSFSTSLASTESTFPIRAPFAGVISSIGKSESEYVQEGNTQEPVMSLEDVSQFFVLANVPEIELLKLGVGDEAVIRLSAVLNRTYTGVIREISLSPVISNLRGWSSRNSQVEYAAKIELTNADDQIRSGISAVVDVISQKREGVLTLGHEFIRRDGSEYFVTLLNGERRKIEIGLQSEEAFEIKGGLNEGDRVQLVDFSQIAQ